MGAIVSILLIFICLFMTACVCIRNCICLHLCVVPSHGRFSGGGPEPGGVVPHGDVIQLGGRRGGRGGG